MRARRSELEHEAPAHRRGDLMNVMLGLVDMLGHELAHLLRIAAPRRRQQSPVRRHIGLPKLVARRRVLVAHRHREAQQVIDDLAHEAQQQVGVGRGQHVVEVQVLLPLHKRLLGAGGMRRAGLDAAFQRGEMLLGEMRHRAGRQLGLEQAAHGVDLRHVELAKEEVVLQKLQRAVQRHLADGGAARRARAHRHQSLHLQRLQRLARGALADAEQLLQLVFLGQLVARRQPALGDPALDLLDHEIAALGTTKGGCHSPYLL